MFWPMLMLEKKQERKKFANFSKLDYVIKERDVKNRIMSKMKL